MRKLFFVFVFAIIFVFLHTTSVKAGCFCYNWTTETYQCANGSGWCTRFICDGTTCGSCPSGQYVSNNVCTDISTPSCFPAGTKVTMSSGGVKNIEDVKIGDKVASKDEKTGERTESSVQSLHQPVSNNICKIDFTNKDQLQVTKGHPLYTQSGWKAIDPAFAAKEDPGVPVTRLMTGDLMSKEDGTWPQIASISCKDTSIQTYNFTVDNSHDYFAGGFLAHNKTGCFPAGTKINMSNGNQKNIEDIKVGDKVISEESNGVRSSGTVQALERPISDHMCTINYTNGKSLDVTNSHPLFTPVGWKAINPEASISENPGVAVTRLLPGDFMKNENGTWPQISSISCRPENNLQVYNFTVDGPHDYFAGGFLAHNKGVCNGCGYDVRQTNPVESINVVNNNTNPVSATISWTGANGTCPGGNNGIHIYIGTDLTTVDHSCQLVNQTSMAGYTPDYSPNCFPMISLPIGPGSFNTLGQVNLKPNKIYYIKVTSFMNFCDSGGECVGGDCGGPNAPFLGSCPVTPNPKEMAVGDTQTFSTFGDATIQAQYDAANTYTHPGKIENAFDYGHWGPNPDPECSSHCGGPTCCYYLDGLQIYGHNLSKVNGGTITVLIKINGHGARSSPSIQAGGYNGDNAYISLAALHNRGFNDAEVMAITADNVTLESQSNPVPNTNNIGSILYTEAYNAGYISIRAPRQVPSAPYQAVVDAIRETTLVSTYLVSGVYAAYFPPPGSSAACSSGSKISVTQPIAKDAWWQVRDSDIQSQGDLGSKVPDPNFFGLNGTGGYPGVAAFTGATNLTTTNVSEKTGAKWLANSTWTNPKIFDYAYFDNLIPANTTVNDLGTSGTLDPATITGGVVDSATGYYWYKIKNASEISMPSLLDVADKKVILLVDAPNFKIGGNIALTRASGFFMLIVKGNTTVDPVVTSLDGLYVSDGVFYSSVPSNQPPVPGAGTDIQLKIRGSVVGYGGVSLIRDLAGSENSTTPAEYFEYAPDQMLRFPSALSTRKINWKEVAP